MNASFLDYSPYISWGADEENSLKLTASLAGDHFLYFRDLKVWFRGDTVSRNRMR